MAAQQVGRAGIQLYISPETRICIQVFNCNVMPINTGEERGCEAGKGRKPKNESVDEYIPPRTTWAQARWVIL